MGSGAFNSETKRVESPAADNVLDPVEEANLLHKVDWRVVPIMLACYTLQILDKVLINYANVMGLQKDLRMKGNDFSWMATAFFIAYVIAEIPQGFLLHRFPVSKVLGFNILCWGILVCCSAAAQNFRDMLALRVLLGVFESVIGPALVLTTAMWYTKRQSGPRYGIWCCGVGCGQILGAIVSFAAQHGMKGAAFGSWRIMMVSVGAINICVALIVLIFLPETVNSARFLTQYEKQRIYHKLALDRAGNGPKVFHLAGLWEIFTDLQIWLLFLLTLITVISSGVITTFSSTLILGFGYSSKQAALLGMPSGVVSIVSVLTCTFAILRGFPRWLSILLLMIPFTIGAGLMSFINRHNQGGKLAGIYLINTVIGSLALIYSWTGANTAGYTKRVASNAAVAIALGVGYIIGPQTFQAKDAPQYLPAKIVLFAVAVAACVVSVALRLLYGVRNKKALRYRESRGMDSNEEKDLTDRENPGFLYVY